jgi:hypothetical protein
MSFKIENLTTRPVLLRLNSGQALHLAPRTISAEIFDVEVENNPKVQKLQDRRVIDLHASGVKKERLPAGTEKAKYTKGKK